MQSVINWLRKILFKNMYVNKLSKEGTYSELDVDKD